MLAQPAAAAQLQAVTPSTQPCVDQGAKGTQAAPVAKTSQYTNLLLVSQPQRPRSVLFRRSSEQHPQVHPCGLLQRHQTFVPIVPYLIRQFLQVMHWNYSLVASVLSRTARAAAVSVTTN